MESAHSAVTGSVIPGSSEVFPHNEHVHSPLCNLGALRLASPPATSFFPLRLAFPVILAQDAGAPINTHLFTCLDARSPISCHARGDDDTHTALSVALAHISRSLPPPDSAKWCQCTLAFSGGKALCLLFHGELHTSARGGGVECNFPGRCRLALAHTGTLPFCLYITNKTYFLTRDPTGSYFGSYLKSYLVT